MFKDIESRIGRGGKGNMGLARWIAAIAVTSKLNESGQSGLHGTILQVACLAAIGSRQRSASQSEANLSSNKNYAFKSGQISLSEVR